MNIFALEHLVRAAGAAILAAPIDLQTKEDGSPVTGADLAAHAILTQGLPDIVPLPVISEEDAHPGNATEAYWLIDPLDGTREYLAGSGHYTVNAALVEKGRPVFGMVGAPALDRLWWGAAGVGSWTRCGRGPARQLQVARRSDGEPWQILVSRFHRDPLTDGFLAALGLVEERSIGSSLKFCLLAEGAGHCSPRFGPTRCWDTAAGQAVLEGAGGAILDLAGKPLRCDAMGLRNPWFIATGGPGTRPPVAALPRSSEAV